MIKTTVNISQATKDFVANNYENQSQGFEYAINNYLVIRQNILLKLKGYFTKEELIALVDMYNGTIYDSKFSDNRFLAIQVEDAEKYENGVSRHGADYDRLLERVKNMHPADSTVLVEELWRFWNVGENNLDEFLNKLI